ncbi:hypothetical protein KP509_15G013200 [Ceratopteris richardii]|uniref:Reverse transcriptase zinc-binding domain-containing protein n=1 Tax=Ceratopteris richardii TaxID=49495 RepID=A0A8T2T220_CERRI|nr:hypothetical protein KP509_15G013200 [Ceratopteris richardii]
MLGILHLHSHLMARREAFIMPITSSHRPLWAHIFWKCIENAEVNFKGMWKLDVWNKQCYVENSLAALYLNNKGMDSIAKYYDSKWELLSFPLIRKIYAVGAIYGSKWLEMVLFLQQYQMSLSIDASNPWRDWLLAKHTRWWTGKASIYYHSLIAPDSIAHQCNQRWKLRKSVARWKVRFLFMWRIFVGHFTLGAFLSQHGLQGAPCPHCSSYAENMCHIFSLCPCIQRWWNALFIFPIWDVKPTKFDCTFLLCVSTDTASDWVRMRCIVLLLYIILVLRNSRVFCNKLLWFCRL